MFLLPVLLQFVLILGKISSLAFFSLIIWSFKKRFIYLFIYSFLAVLHCCTRAFCSGGELGLLFVAVPSFSWWLLFLLSVGSRRVGFISCGLWALDHGLHSCGTRILVAPWYVWPGPNLCPWRWQTDSFFFFHRYCQSALFSPTVGVWCQCTCFFFFNFLSLLSPFFKKKNCLF